MTWQEPAVIAIVLCAVAYVARTFLQQFGVMPAAKQNHCSQCTRCTGELPSSKQPSFVQISKAPKSD